MKRVLLALLCIPFLGIAQTTRTTTMDGDFYNPAIWSPLGLPTDGDSLIIDHAVNMDFGIPYTAGRITINANGSLTDGGTDKDIYINGGSLENNGLLDCDGLWLDSGMIMNTGTMILDSLWTQGDFFHMGGASLEVFDFLHDQYATFDASGNIVCGNNFNNQGVFILNGDMTVANDASNCNIQDTDATLFLYGDLCVSADFLNCATDTIRGAGTLRIAGASTNAGEVEGTVTVMTPGGGFDLNTGTIEGTVTLSTGSCDVSVEDEELMNWSVYPNPTNDKITSSIAEIDYVIVELSGRTVQSGSTTDGVIRLDQLSAGLYGIEMTDKEGNTHFELIKKY